MKRAVITVVLLTSVLLAGCTEQKKWLSQDELFKKKQECITYKTSLQEEIDKKTQMLWKADILYTETIDEIFYSIAENSCFAVTYVVTSINWDYIHKNTIINLLSNERDDYGDEGGAINSTALFSERMRRLKWE